MERPLVGSLTAKRASSLLATVEARDQHSGERGWQLTYRNIRSRHTVGDLIDDMNAPEWMLYCAGCGERIGLYEPLWWRPPGGPVIASAYLLAKYDPRFRHPDSRFLHFGCLARDELPNPHSGPDRSTAGT
jgi:hypothetical protein